MSSDRNSTSLKHRGLSFCPPRVVVDGKFFRLDGRKFCVKGITYGPFAPNARGEMFPEPDQTRRDFEQIRELNANVIRVYYAPPRWLLDLAAQHGLRLLVDIPWPKHLCFLDSDQIQAEARRAVRQAVETTKGHPAMFAYSVVNEISAEIVRWSGAARVQEFIDELIDEAKAVDPHCLCTFTSYPPTEFLQPQNADFVCFNLYLHDPKAHGAYLARLQMLADAKPLILGEFGMDSLRESELRKCEFLTWQIEGAFRNGLAGIVVFSYTDDWFRSGMQIEDWAFGLTTRDRQPKASFRAVQKQYRIAPYFPLPRNAKVSVVVATHNGARTLNACLDSLQRLNYPNYEVILVDDGSTDRTPEFAKKFPSVCYLRQENLGLSAARNAGIAAATGEIVAFTDDDCRADEDWLYYLTGDLLRSEFAGIGGHNFLPPEDSYVAAAVLVSPGGPAHVMLTDREAEHIPGCNMAFYKWALDEIRGFDPIFRKAGDDVDACWRLQQRNRTIGFSPTGFVWHYRRSTIRAYLKQQAGYGEAEALLSQKHPEYYNSLGGGIWRGRIYSAGKSGVILGRPVIYHGVFGSGFFQRLYTPKPTTPPMLCTTLGYHIFVNVPLLLLSVYVGFFRPVALASLLLGLGTCVIAAAQARLSRHKQRFWSRPLIALMFFLQPIVRNWARFHWRLRVRGSRQMHLPEVKTVSAKVPDVLCYWSKGDVDRYRFLNTVREKLARHACNIELDTGWSGHDLEIAGERWSRLRLTTVTEELELGRKNFQCRLKVVWPLGAILLFWTVVIAEFLAITLLAQEIPWLWLLPVSLPILGWFVSGLGNDFRLATVSLLDDAAECLGLVKLDGARDGAQEGALNSP